MGELLCCGQVAQDGSRELAERQPDRLVQRPLGPERGDRQPDALLEIASVLRSAWSSGKSVT
jgi:hypothetical protein